MKYFIKKVLKNNKNLKLYQLSSAIYKRYSPYINIMTNMVFDTYFYIKHSNVFSSNTLHKIEARIILDYHSIEKGLLFKKTKFGFGQEKVKRLNKLLQRKDVLKNNENSQINVAYRIMCQYYELHQKNNFDISSYFSEKDYFFYKETLSSFYNANFNCYFEFSYKDFFSRKDSKFDVFSDSRKSVRNFTGNKIDDSIIYKAIALANNAPSVCNRQPSKVYYVKNKKKIDQILEIQAGLNGFSDNIHQLLILVTDVNYYYSVGERYQFYIDGGVYLMNLLYALHFYQIAACPANWAKEKDDERKLKRLINAKNSEKAICIVAIGQAEESFRTTLSKRREINEVLTVIEN